MLVPPVLDTTIQENITTFEFEPPPVGKNKLGSVNVENGNIMDQKEPDLGDVPKEISLPEDFMSSEILVDPKSKVSTESNSNLLQNEIEPILQAFPEWNVYTTTSPKYKNEGDNIDYFLYICILRNISSVF